MDVTFVIPVRNDAIRLRRCLDTVKRELADTAGAIVVVDNGSTDDSAAVASAMGAHVVSAPGVPVAVARNEGVRQHPYGDVIAFVDADHELLPGWLVAARSALDRPQVTAASAAYLGPPAPTAVQRWYGALRGETSAEAPIEWAGAGNLVIRRPVFERVGGFDESLEACEDVDLCFRVRQAGGTIWGTPGMRSVHHGDPRTLGHLFRGELWRGRGNIRVSLRGPWSPRSVASMALPVLQLLALPGAALLALATSHGMGALLASLVLLVGPACLRTLLLFRRRRPESLNDAVAGLAVCLTYDVARALALVRRAEHHSVARKPGS